MMSGMQALAQFKKPFNTTEGRRSWRSRRLHNRLTDQYEGSSSAHPNLKTKYHICTVIYFYYYVCTLRSNYILRFDTLFLIMYLIGVTGNNSFGNFTMKNTLIEIYNRWYP